MNRKERIGQLEEQLRARGAQFMVGDDFDEEMRESFLEHVLQFENAERKPLREWLGEQTTDLHELLERLALLGIAVECCDHLSDDELLARLTERLDDQVALLPGTVLHMELIDDADHETWLTYYASDEDRARWKEEFPDEVLPPKRKPQYVRNMPEPFRGDRGEA